MTRMFRGLRVHPTLPSIPKVVFDSAVRVYRGYLEQGRLPSEHPWVIHLETRSICNSRCTFCAAAVTNPSRPPDTLMPEALIEKILTELSEIRYANRLSFYNNNEPFLDPRIVEIVTRARRRLPRAYLEVKTNGMVLTLDKILQIFDAGLDVLFINDYVSDGKPSARLQTLREELNQLQRFKEKRVGGKFISSRVIISTRRLDEALNTRAGTAPNKTTLREPLRTPCFRPFEMMTVNPAGFVAVCSDDVYFKTPMGNVNEQSLMDIWNSERWREMRLRLLDGQRGCYANTCRDCDNQNPKLELMQAAGVPIPRQRIKRLLRFMKHGVGSLTSPVEYEAVD